MKRLYLFAVVVLCACTPVQLAAYEATVGQTFTDTDRAVLLELPDAPMKLPDGRMLDANGTITAAPAMSGACAMWADTAFAAGFTTAHWPTVNRIMYRESRCDPGAYNPSGATGLMQIMPMWADDCGGTRTDLYDPAFNLACARHILTVQGWAAWAVR